MIELKEFKLTRDDYLEVKLDESLTEVDFIHYDANGKRILMDSMEVTLNEIVKRSKGAAIDKRPVYILQYAHMDKSGYVKKVLTTSSKVYKRYLLASAKAAKYNEIDDRNRSWIEKLLMKIKLVKKYKWIVSAIEWE